MSQKINIGIAEDQGLMREGFIRMLSDFNEIKILFAVDNGKELLKSLKENKPSIILLDIAMPVLGGIKAMEKIKERYPKMKIIVISGFSEEMSILEYVRRGANGFVNKNTNVKKLMEAIRTVDETGSYFDEKTSKLLAKYGLLPNYQNERELTERELIVLKLICVNKAPSEIAKLMGIKEITIAGYKHKIFQKTNSQSIEELISYAERNGVV